MKSDRLICARKLNMALRKARWLRGVELFAVIVTEFKPVNGKWEVSWFAEFFNGFLFVRCVDTR